ncbi:insulinase family protein [bacterium]|nr:insulinase family protein [bacterium]
MKEYAVYLILSLLFVSVQAQEVSFTEYDLENGLHVILHQDNTAPVVTTSVLYHVGAKDELKDRTGFAHFFEHLLFEGTKNIGRGEWYSIVSSNGGKNNAFTSNDYTYYYEILPSNSLELGLWLESERMLHPVINQDGIDTQKDVIKEEKKVGEERPYGKVLDQVQENLFINHPYKRTVIGESDHLDAASLEEFIAFNKKYYVPNNAILVVAGDIQIDATKKMIADYFGTIPGGADVDRVTEQEDPITEAIEAKAYDSNIQIPMIVTAYRTPSIKSRDSKTLDMISSYLSDGNSSKLYRKVVDEKKMALEVGAINLSLEDHSMYIIYGLPLGETSLESIISEIDEEVVKIQEGLISEKDYQKLQNKFETNFVDSNSSVEGIANSLAEYYAFYKDTNLINSEIEIYRSISREEIQAVAKKYLNPNQRLVLDYLPESSK